jgi:para-aminobenzoate synthetase component 1
MKCFQFPIDYCDPAAVFDGYYDRPYALFLDSSDRKHPDARYSFIMSDPVEVLELNYTDKPFEKLEALQKKYSFESEEFEYPFTGGIAGYFGYDLGRALEHLPSEKTNPSPDMVVGVYDQVIAFDHHEQKACIFVWSNEPLTTPPTVLSSLGHLPPAGGGKLSFSEAGGGAAKRAIERTIQYILEGDIFQANIAQEWSAEIPPDFCTWTHYKHLRQQSPAPFGAYMNCGESKIASVSPERFLHLQNGYVTTRPIKGTLPADQDPQILIDSGKDRAENIMIVDLLRNDLSKVCEAGSISVSNLCKLESFSSVHHLVSTVEGQLKDDTTAIDLLKACFPGGSITGAPKIRAMEIIDELEPFKRGPYCGAMGYIGFDGAMDTNILIRTLVYEGGRVTLKAGGGITAASDPDAEIQEMHDKARRILESFSFKPRRHEIH